MSIFDPNGVVTYDQAITMVMRALGYTEAALNGVYPACFVSKAVSLGAMKNLHSGSGDANRADCAQLIFNVLQSPIGKVGNNNIWVAYGKGEDGSGAYDNMLVRLGAHIALKDCDKDLSKTNPVDVQVVTQKFMDQNESLIDLKTLLGHKISFYHNDEEEIVAIADIMTTEITGKMNDDKTKIGDVKVADSADMSKATYFLNG